MYARSLATGVRWMTIGWRGVLPLLALGALLLAGCGQTTRGTGASVTAPTATSAPTATPIATPLPTAPASEAAAICGQRWNTRMEPILHVGDLYISTTRLAGFAAPGIFLPDGTLLQPLKVAMGDTSLLSVGPAVNPQLLEYTDQGGFEINVCNASVSQSHVVQGVHVTLASFTPYSGQLNMWKNCDMAYTHAQPGGGGCGGHYAADEYLRATFAQDAPAGTSVTAAQTASEPGGHGPMPVTLKAHDSTILNIGVVRPTASGTYQFSFTVTVDGTDYAPANPPATLFAPVAHEWSGGACAKFSAQIPPDTTPPTYYVCPE